ncbi:MAG: hypothetical protein E3J54_06190 [Actinobacteria bacterium]|nr:MAG: hypothetical protein E3J54_06190 [Actinomycetota bacterium]
MPIVNEEVHIKASADDIYHLIQKTKNIADLYKEIQVNTIEEEEDYRITDIKLTLDEDSFSWRQRENFDPEMLRVDYSYIEGDFMTFDARFQVLAEEDESELLLHIELTTGEIGIIAYIKDFFLTRRMREVARDIINAVKDQLELSYG